MTSIFKTPVIFLCLFSALVLSASTVSNNSSSSISKDKAVVLLKFKAQPDKSAQAMSAMMELLKEVKKEPHFIKIQVHVDPEDPSNILFYEEWDDLAYYKGDHMNTEHLQAFMTASGEFLMGPPEITFWSLQRVVQ